MKRHRLNIILDKCSNRKFKNGFIQYLRSLDFEEFEILFNYYTSVLTKLMIRYKYKEEKHKIFSKKWFRDQSLSYKYQQINLLFYEANYDFIEKVNKKIKDNNKKISELLVKIRKINESIVVVNGTKIEFVENPTTIEVITLISVLVEHIYNKNELDKLMEELNKFSK